MSQTPNVDPLYDPAFLIFVYSAWAITAFTIGQTAGLAVLVVATVVFTTIALRQRVPDPNRFVDSDSADAVQRPFVNEFGVILLFCAAAIGVGVLLLAGFTLAPVPMLVLLTVCTVGAVAAMVKSNRPVV